MVLKTLQLCQVQLLLGILLLYSCNSVHEVASIASQQETKSQKWHHWLLEKDNLDRLNRTVFTLIIFICSCWKFRSEVGLNSQGYLTACWEFEEACCVFILPKWSHAESSGQEGLCAHRCGHNPSSESTACINPKLSDCSMTFYLSVLSMNQYRSKNTLHLNSDAVMNTIRVWLYHGSVYFTHTVVVGIIGILYGKFLVMPLRQNRFNNSTRAQKSLPRYLWGRSS
jgi:hypothetical protein